MNLESGIHRTEFNTEWIGLSGEKVQGVRKRCGALPLSLYRESLRRVDARRDASEEGHLRAPICWRDSIFRSGTSHSSKPNQKLALCTPSLECPLMSFRASHGDSGQSYVCV